MSITVSIKVRKEIVEIAEKMIRYGIAKSRSQAFNMMIEKGLNEVLKEVKFWDQVYGKAEELEKRGFKLKHGRLSKLLEEDRAR